MNHGAATDDLDAKHLGDLGNITASADGTAEATFTIANFPDDQDVAGHAIIVHAEADDRESDPGGTSGAREGCGGDRGADVDRSPIASSGDPSTGGPPVTPAGCHGRALRV